MKKALKITRKVLRGILVCLVAFLIVLKVWDMIAVVKEKELLKNHPGEFVEVDN